MSKSTATLWSVAVLAVWIISQSMNFELQFDSKNDAWSGEALIRLKLGGVLRASASVEMMRPEPPWMVLSSWK